MNIESVEVVEIPNCVLCQETTYGMLDWLLYTTLKAPRSLHEMPTKNYFHCKQAPVMLTKPDGAIPGHLIIIIQLLRITDMTILTSQLLFFFIFAINGNPNPSNPRSKFWQVSECPKLFTRKLVSTNQFRFQYPKCGYNGCVMASLYIGSFHSCDCCSCHKKCAQRSRLFHYEQCRHNYPYCYMALANFFLSWYRN